MENHLHKDCEIIAALQIPTDSEDGLDWDDSDEDPDYQPTTDLLSYADNNDVAEPLTIENVVTNDAQPGTSTSDTALQVTINSNTCKPSSRNIIWRKNDIVYDEEKIKFLGNSNLSSEVTNLTTPLEFFEYFFDHSILNFIVEETRRYSIQCNPNKPFCVDIIDIKHYIGICIMMSIVHLPNVRKYWSSVIGNDVIKETMPVNKFEKIRKYLHFSNSEEAIPPNQPGHDRLFKLRPIIDLLRKKFQSVPLEESLSLDEQLCATKAKHYLKQYIPMKPHKWGYKVFVLCGISGYAYDFELYSGQENCAIDRLAHNEPDLGASSNVVVRLSRCIENNVHHKLYFDNFYTSIPLEVYLEKRGIHCLGTVRRNRVPGVKLPNETEIKKMIRGSSAECTGSSDDVELSCTVWKDNKAVTLLSTFVGQKPFVKSKRYDRKKNENIEISCPKAVDIYNKHMGGVDLIDSMLGRYKICMRSKKWYFRIFYHLLDITVINAWLLSKRVSKEKGTHQNRETLADFRETLALTLCKAGSLSTSTRGRPRSEEENVLVSKRRKVTSVSNVPTDIRWDQLSHWPKYLLSRQRCKLNECGGKTFIACSKCNVALCFNKDKYCFINFHNK